MWERAKNGSGGGGGGTLATEELWNSGGGGPFTLTKDYAVLFILGTRGQSGATLVYNGNTVSWDVTKNDGYEYNFIKLILDAKTGDTIQFGSTAWAFVSGAYYE